MTHLTDMAAIVTGASSGIGGGIARMLAANFADFLRGHRSLHGSRD